MNCPRCHRVVDETDRFCKNCGFEFAEKQDDEIIQKIRETKEKYGITGSYYTEPERPQKKPSKWKIILIVIAALFVFGIINSVLNDKNDSDQSSKSTVENTGDSKKNSKNNLTDEETTERKTDKEIENDYKSSCESVDYKSIARNPDQYDGRYVKFTGSVIQVSEHSWISSEYRIAVTKDKYGNWDDVVYVYFNLPDGADRILEDDIVTFYGKCTGTTTYITVLGSTITIPSVEAEYIDINK
ncbi:MAG: hypothetical protein IJL52_02390 [Clostridia bacterium]|nr:hypothetical protein [Clostridia bacterium]